MTCAGYSTSLFTPCPVYVHITVKGGQHMRVTHVLSAFDTGLNPFIYYIYNWSKLFRPNYHESLPKLGIIITRQSADWFQMIHQDIALIRIIDLFAEMILYNAY